MNKEYKIKKTRELIKKLKPYWEQMKHTQATFNAQIHRLETLMEKETGIKGIEFFYCDNECVGIGNAERSMELIHGHEELEDE